jgi:arylsulfatase A
MISRIIFCLTVTAFAGGHAWAVDTRPPNLILIMADDFGYECVTANGGQSYRTPHLDKLAATGMRFEHCHVQPLCTPTRVQLMTGQYNVRNYVRFGLLDPQATTLAHLLKRAGYATGVTGKWQLGQDKDLPRRFGFDEAFLWQHTRRPPRYANPGLELNGEEKNFQDGEYGPKLINDFALDFVTRHREAPFLLYYPMILPHEPFQPTPDSPSWDPQARGANANRHVKHFADMTAYMDKMIGRLMAKLDELRIRENTLVIFLGDNGTHPSITSQFKGRPYPGGKGSGTARGTHVPLIANWPGRIPAGGVNADLIASTDFLPTLCEAAGTKIPESLPIDGRSFLPQLRGLRGQPREWLYCWYAQHGGPKATIEFAMSTTHKLYRDGRFFKLAADPFEEQPLSSAKLTGADAQAVRTLQAALDQFSNARPAQLLKPAGEKAKPGRGRGKDVGKSETSGQTPAATKDPITSHDPYLCLFVDDHWIAEQSGLKRIVNRARPLAEPIVWPDNIRTETDCAWGNVIREPDGRFRLWYVTMMMGHSGGGAHEMAKAGRFGSWIVGSDLFRFASESGLELDEQLAGIEAHSECATSPSLGLAVMSGDARSRTRFGQSAGERDDRATASAGRSTVC